MGVIYEVDALFFPRWWGATGVLVAKFPPTHPLGKAPSVMGQRPKRGRGNTLPCIPTYSTSVVTLKDLPLVGSLMILQDDAVALGDHHPASGKLPNYPGAEGVVPALRLSCPHKGTGHE